MYLTLTHNVLVRYRLFVYISGSIGQ